MYYFTVRFDILPGKEKELDAFIDTKARQFWLAQPGVHEFRVYNDAFIEWPARTLVIGVNDLYRLQMILDSEERKQMRSELLTYAKHPVWQLLELQGHGDVSEKMIVGGMAGATT